MILENKLGITSSVELAHEEELLTKRRALELYDKGLLNTFEVGTFDGLAKIHGSCSRTCTTRRKDAHGQHRQGRIPLRTLHLPPRSS